MPNMRPHRIGDTKIGINPILLASCETRLNRSNQLKFETALATNGILSANRLLAPEKHYVKTSREEAYRRKIWRVATILS
jgi:hypothetical protein